MKKLWFLLFAALCMQSTCDKDPVDPVVDNLANDADLVTGLQGRDANGQTVGTFGNPNAKNLNTEAYPNPADGEVAVSSQEKVQTVWLITGDVDTSFAATDFQTLLATQSYSQTDIKSASLQEWPIGTSNQFTLDVSAVSTGYYRVFFLMEDGSVRWDNLYIDHEHAYPQSLNLVAKFWK